MEEINVNLKLPMGIGVVVVVVDISARFFLNAVDIDNINWDIIIYFLYSRKLTSYLPVVQ